MGYYVGYEPYKPTYHHNARPPVKVRKHARRKRWGRSRRFAARLERGHRWYVEDIVDGAYKYPPHPEPDGA